MGGDGKKEREIKKNNVGYITILNNLGFIYKKQHMYAPSLLAYQKALEIREEMELRDTDVDGEKLSPEMIMLLNIIAECHRADGREEKAIDIQERILKSLG